jgi:hypothetical protein
LSYITALQLSLLLQWYCIDLSGILFKDLPRTFYPDPWPSPF